MTSSSTASSTTAVSSSPRAAQRAVEHVGLRERAREAVQEEAAAAVLDVVRERVEQHRHDELVRHEAAGVDVRGGLLAELGLVGAVLPEQVAGGEVAEAEVVAQGLGLRALAGARCAEQYEVHVTGSRTARRA